MPASKRLLSPDNCTLLLIDHQPQMLFGVQSHDRASIMNAVVGLAKAAKVFNVPTILSTVAAKTFSGPLFPELQAVYPDLDPIDRTNTNAWEDENFVKAVKQTGRKKVVMAALWTEVCLAYPALSALEDGYEVYAVADASGGVTREAHDRAMERMIQAGVMPVTWEQVMYEWQRDWALTKTADMVRQVAVAHAGAFGQGILYAKEMWGAEESTSLSKARQREIA